MTDPEITATTAGPAPERETAQLTPEMIDARIAAEAYHQFPGTTMIVCLLTLTNGAYVTGGAAGIAADFDEATARRVAREAARSKIWALEGYLLRERQAAAAAAANGR